MMLLAIAFKNLAHRPVRSLLTVAGISVGIAAVVAMIGVAGGFEKGWERIYTARGTDLILSRITSQSPMPELFDEGMKAEMEALPNVEKSAGVLDDVTGIEDVPMVLVFGWDLKGYLWEHLRLAKGRLPANDTEDAVVLGSVLADVMGKKVGDPIEIETGQFTVCGIFESTAFIENSSVVMSLARLQALMGHSGKVRHFNMKLKPEATEKDVEALRALIRERHPGFKAYTVGEIARDNSAIRGVKAMSFATSVIALLIGMVGVMNTMLMSVFERIHEIGVLLAIGWRRSRIVRMVLCESVALSFVGGLVGLGLGILLIKGIQLVPVVRGKLEGEVTWTLFFASMAVALGVGILGGLYPAILGSRLLPSEAIRRE